MAATDVFKPDHAASRRHFIFNEEHSHGCSVVFIAQVNLNAT